MSYKNPHKQLLRQFSYLDVAKIEAPISYEPELKWEGSASLPRRRENTKKYLRQLLLYYKSSNISLTSTQTKRVEKDVITYYDNIMGVGNFAYNEKVKTVLMSYIKLAILHQTIEKTKVLSYRPQRLNIITLEQEIQNIDRAIRSLKDKSKNKPGVKEQKTYNKRFKRMLYMNAEAKTTHFCLISIPLYSRLPSSTQQAISAGNHLKVLPSNQITNVIGIDNPMTHYIEFELSTGQRVSTLQDIQQLMTYNDINARSFWSDMRMLQDVLNSRTDRFLKSTIVDTLISQQLFPPGMLEYVDKTGHDYEIQARPFNIWLESKQGLRMFANKSSRNKGTHKRFIMGQFPIIKNQRMQIGQELRNQYFDKTQLSYKDIYYGNNRVDAEGKGFSIKEMEYFHPHIYILTKGKQDSTLGFNLGLTTTAFIFKYQNNSTLSKITFNMEKPTRIAAFPPNKEGWDNMSAELLQNVLFMEQHTTVQTYGFKTIQDAEISPRQKTFRIITPSKVVVDATVNLDLIKVGEEDDGDDV